MCGITGFIGQGNEQDLSSMVASIKYRGPDRQGIFKRNSVGFAHARLSIMDLSDAGNQPMLSSDGTAAIVFNGEVYNFLEIRKELEATGKYQFKSQTDTEVIINAYREFGLQCFSKMNGMFAIAIYDFTSEKLILARDPMGKKPLYWGIFDGTLIFGSELKALMQHPLFKKELDLESLNKYLLCEYVPTPRTIFKNVHKLEPASYLVFDGQKTDIHEYWKMDFTLKNVNLDVAINELDNLINDSVKRRLVADVPLGIFLSGGLDSSTVAYYAQQNSTSTVKTFSIGFRDKSFDEGEYAKQVAEYLKTDHKHHILEPQETLDVISEIYDSLDEPMADQSIIPTYLLSKFTREYVTVALGGDGGDELFAGYPTFQAEKMVKIYKFIPGFMRHGVIEPLIKAMPVSTKNFSLDFIAKRFISGLDVPDLYRHAEWLGNFHKKDREKLFVDKVWSSLKNVNEFSEIDNYVDKLKNTDLDSTFLHLYQRTYMMDGVMVKVDRASMLHALEARAPFLDREVVDYVNALPYRYKLHGFTTKFILKKLMEGKLPKNIIYRKKKGFGVPTASWLRGELKLWCEDVLSEKNITEIGLFDYSYIRTLKENHYNGSENNHKKLWTLIVFILWYKKFMV